MASRGLSNLDPANTKAETFPCPSCPPGLRHPLKHRRTTLPPLSTQGGVHRGDFRVWPWARPLPCLCPGFPVYIMWGWGTLPSNSLSRWTFILALLLILLPLAGRAAGHPTAQETGQHSRKAETSASVTRQPRETASQLSGGGCRGGGSLSILSASCFHICSLTSSALAWERAGCLSQGVRSGGLSSLRRPGCGAGWREQGLLTPGNQ